MIFYLNPLNYYNIIYYFDIIILFIQLTKYYFIQTIYIYFIKYNNKQKKKTKQTKTIKKNKRRTLKAGKTFSESEPVNLFYESKQVLCNICNNNVYEEITGILGKSKVRSGVGDFFFGSIAGVVDSTSIITYVCKRCGNCKIIRNSSERRVRSVPVSSNNLVEKPVEPVV